MISILTRAGNDNPDRMRYISSLKSHDVYFLRRLESKNNFKTFSSVKAINLKKYRAMYEGHGEVERNHL